MILSRTDYLAAEAAVRPTRDWYGKPFRATGTLSYAPPIAEGVSEADFPVLDDAVKAPLVSAFPAWSPGITVSAGQILVYDGDLVRVLKPHTTQADWTPDRAVSLFSRTLLDDAVRPWRQPQGEHDAYPIGHVVTHDGKTWRVVQGDARGLNVWQPGVFGWEEIL